LANAMEQRQEEETRAYSRQIASWRENRKAQKWVESLTAEQRAALAKKINEGDE